MTGESTSKPGGEDPPRRLKKRPEFLRAATGRKVHAALFTIQACGRPAAEEQDARVGITVTKKVAGAVERNRIRRRLREVVRIVPGLGIKPSHDYVIVARRAVLDQPFPALVSGLKAAIGRLHRQAAAKQGAQARGDGRSTAHFALD